MAETPKHLEPSALGTREYWDKLYTTEIANHAANPDDIGTVWFDDSDAEDKMLAFLARLAGSPAPDESDSEDDADSTEAADDAPTPTSATVLSKATTSFLDLGCGNGSILFALRARGWRGALVGVDYSAHSIRLATQVASARGLSDHIRFAEWDLLQGAPPPLLPPPPPQTTTFDVVLDKGTFDAISLSDATDAQGRRACEGYKARVLPLLAEHGLFLITSCNWTEDELRGWFAGGDSVEGAALEEAGRVKYRSFSFGGVSGQTISTLCFRKISAPASSSTEQAEPVHTRMQT